MPLYQFSLFLFLFWVILLFILIKEALLAVIGQVSSNLALISHMKVKSI
jgi:hypothetical protein